MHIFWNFTECMNKSKLFTFCFPETLQLFMVHATGKLDLSFIAGSLTKHLSCSLCLFCPFVIYQDGNFTKTDAMSKPDETTLIGQSSFVDFGKNYKDFSICLFAVFLCKCETVIGLKPSTGMYFRQQGHMNRAKMEQNKNRRRQCVMTICAVKVHKNSQHLVTVWTRLDCTEIYPGVCLLHPFLSS